MIYYKGLKKRYPKRSISSSGLALKTLARVIIRGEGVETSDHGRRGADPATLVYHFINGSGFAGEDGLNGAIPAVTYPALETELTSVVDRPVPEEDSLNAALDDNPHLDMDQRRR